MGKVTERNTVYVAIPTLEDHIEEGNCDAKAKSAKSKAQGRSSSSVAKAVAIDNNSPVSVYDGNSDDDEYVEIGCEPVSRAACILSSGFVLTLLIVGAWMMFGNCSHRMHHSMLSMHRGPGGHGGMNGGMHMHGGMHEGHKGMGGEHHGHGHHWGVHHSGSSSSSSSSNDMEQHKHDGWYAGNESHDGWHAGHHKGKGHHGHGGKGMGMGGHDGNGHGHKHSHHSGDFTLNGDKVHSGDHFMPMNDLEESNSSGDLNMDTMELEPEGTEEDFAPEDYDDDDDEMFGKEFNGGDFEMAFGEVARFDEEKEDGFIPGLP